LPAVELAALGAPFLAGAAALDRARAALNAVGVGHLAGRGVAEMSGGERALYHALYPARHALFSSDEFARACGFV
jgi:ABC-type hemin transport system ATPase subunit